MGKKQIMGIDMDAIKIEVEMPEWKHLMLPTACICCDCSFFFEYPECCSCREVGTCLCCTGAAECSIDTKHFDQSFCCQAVSVAYCISVAGCKDPGCMKTIWGQEAGSATCCFIFNSKYKGQCHMCPLDPFMCCKVGEQCLWQILHGRRPNGFQPWIHSLRAKLRVIRLSSSSRGEASRDRRIDCVRKALADSSESKGS